MPIDRFEEVWTPIKDFPDYVVSTQGRVANVHTERILREATDSYGYKRVSLRKEGVSYNRYVHRLVAQAFMRGFSHTRRMRWVDEDPSNNSIMNLAFQTYGAGTYIEPPQTHIRKRVLVVERGESFPTVGLAARYFKTSPSCIYRVLRGEREQHLGYSFKYIELEEAIHYE